MLAWLVTRTLGSPNVTTVTPSGRAGADSAKRPATIPTQRSGQTLRLLVLGTGQDAAAFRARAAEAGAELAQRFSVRVTHVVVEEGVGEDDARVVRARGAGLPVLGLAEGNQLIEEEQDAGEGGVRGEEGDAGREGGAGEKQEAGEDVVAEGLAPDSARRGAARADVSADGDVVPLIRPRAEVVPEPGDGGPSDVFTGSALEAMLQFPPLPANEFEGEGGDSDEFESGDSDEFERLDGGADAEPFETFETAAKARTVEAEQAEAVLSGDEEMAAAETVAGADGDEARSASVLMDVVSEACACAEAESGTAGGRVAVAGDEAGTAAEAACTEAGCAAARCTATHVDAVASAGERIAAGTAASVAWALVPLVSLGLLTPVSIGYAAYRLRSRGLAIATACYTVAVVAVFAVSDAVPVHTRAHSIIGDLLTMCLAASWLGGTAHSFILRRKVFR